VERISEASLRQRIETLPVDNRRLRNELARLNEEPASLTDGSANSTLQRPSNGWVDADRCELLCLDLEKAKEPRAMLLGEEAAARLAERAKALGDPTRLRLAATLAQTDELCVCDLAWVAGRAENLISHHLRVLRSAGLVSSRRDGKMVLYRLTEPGRGPVATVLDPSARRYEHARARGATASSRTARQP
jgi:DNA-binding transcriptional ArsR family regulator